MIEYIMLKGNLANAITVLSAHFLIVRLLIHFIPEDNGQSYLLKRLGANIGFQLYRFYNQTHHIIKLIAKTQYTILIITKF